MRSSPGATYTPRCRTIPFDTLPTSLVGTLCIPRSSRCATLHYHVCPLSLIQVYQPMNSMEDILQDIFMRDRNTVYVARPGKLHGLKKFMRSITSWKRGRIDSSFLLPRSMRRGF
ncbi:hypothetical protein BDZ97DRAFT_256269 [Flammula alnicola]|nr:hypothetical protein BDZ97DRAFT_256269 [Flammula alnicola]